MTRSPKDVLAEYDAKRAARGPILLNQEVEPLAAALRETLAEADLLRLERDEARKELHHERADNGRFGSRLQDECAKLKARCERLEAELEKERDELAARLREKEAACERYESVLRWYAEPGPEDSAWAKSGLSNKARQALEGK